MNSPKINLTELAKKIAAVAEGRNGPVTLEQSAKLTEAIDVIGELVAAKCKEGEQ